MKVKVVLLGLVAVLLLSAQAEASSYFLPYGQARKLSKVWVREACEASGPSCVTWKVGHCARIASDRVDCGAGIAFRDEVCGFVLENRVMGNGYIHQRRRALDCERF